MEKVKHEFAPDKPLYMIDLAEGKVIKEVWLYKKGRDYVNVSYTSGATTKYCLFLLKQYSDIDKYFEGDFPVRKLFQTREDAQNYVEKLSAISFIKHNVSWAKLSLDSLLKIIEEIKKSEVEENGA